MNESELKTLKALGDDIRRKRDHYREARRSHRRSTASTAIAPSYPDSDCAEMGKNWLLACHGLEAAQIEAAVRDEPWVVGRDVWDVFLAALAETACENIAHVPMPRWARQRSLRRYEVVLGFLELPRGHNAQEFPAFYRRGILLAERNW